MKKPFSHLLSTILMFIGSGLFFFGCGNNGNNQQQIRPTNGAYNGSCMNNMGQPMPAQYCNGAGNNGMYGNGYGGNGYGGYGNGYGGYGTGYGNGYGTGYGTGFGGSQPCSGTFYVNNGYGYQPVNCTPDMCRGYTVYTQAGQPITCM